VADYTKAIATDPTYALAYFTRGHVYLRLGYFKLARKDLQTAPLFLNQGDTLFYQQTIRVLNSL
jgi:Tfp pilus assembly protein PilF